MLNKKVLLIILLVVVLGAGGVFYFMFFSKTGDNNGHLITSQPAVNNAGQLPEGDDIADGGGADNQPQIETNRNNASQSEVDALNLARFFVEMIGSYSPEANFQNIIDLQPMMTEKMINWSNDFIKRNSGQSVGEKITTKVAQIELVDFDENKAKISAQTRRTKVENEQEVDYNQQAEVYLIKDAGSWKVDSINWK